MSKDHNPEHDLGACEKCDKKRAAETERLRNEVMDLTVKLNRNRDAIEEFTRQALLRVDEVQRLRTFAEYVRRINARGLHEKSAVSSADLSAAAQRALTGSNR